MKKINYESDEILLKESIPEAFTKTKKISKQTVKFCLFLLAIVITGFSVLFTNASKISVLSLEDGISPISIPIAATASKKDIITIPTGIVKTNPFVPYRALGNEITIKPLVNDVPKFDLISPPESLNENSDAVKIMNTVVSGILYDKFSPSAILNIDGNDYLVKKGDSVNNYKVLAINKDSVTVKLGNNTYTAGIGELLTESDIRYNEVSNLNKKFGGEQR